MYSTRILFAVRAQVPSVPVPVPVSGPVLRACATHDYSAGRKRGASHHVPMTPCAREARAIDTWTRGCCAPHPTSVSAHPFVAQHRVDGQERQCSKAGQARPAAQVLALASPFVFDTSRWWENATGARLLPCPTQPVTRWGVAYTLYTLSASLFYHRDLGRWMSRWGPTLPTTTLLYYYTLHGAPRCKPLCCTLRDDDAPVTRGCSQAGHIAGGQTYVL